MSNEGGPKILVNPITDRQRDVLVCIRKSLDDHAYAPTLREIGDALDIQSTNGVTEHLQALIRKGYVEKDGQKSRALRLTKMGMIITDPPRLPDVRRGNYPSNPTEGIEQTYSVVSSLRYLADAADHLLHDHNCDTLHWEQIVAAKDAARIHADRLEKSGDPESERDALRSENAKLRRRLETASPWQAKSFTEEEMRAIESRWATGPERYQADADSMIAFIRFLKGANQELRARIMESSDEKLQGAATESVEELFAAHRRRES